MEWLLGEFEIPFHRDSLHCGGNDANFTLRALLMIAVRDAEMRGGLDEGQEAILVVLSDLARLKVPENGMRYFD